MLSEWIDGYVTTVLAGSTKLSLYASLQPVPAVKLMMAPAANPIAAPPSAAPRTLPPSGVRIATMTPTTSAPMIPPGIVPRTIRRTA